MSSGMLLLAGLFATGPAAAQPEVAPMPRAKSARIAVEFRIDLSPRGITFGAGVGPVKPMPIPVALAPIDDSAPTITLPRYVPAQRNARPAETPMTVDAGHGLRIHVPPLGANQCPNSGPPPEVHAMMLQTFGQMGAPLPQPPTPPLCPPVMTASWTPATLPRPTVEIPEGTWTRTVGPVRYKLEVKAKTLTVTTTLTEDEDDGKVATIDHVLTIDWYPTRNSNEIVGLVTGFDIAMHDKTMSRDEISGLLASLANIQKQLNGKPVALTWRMNDGTLVVGDVRLPELKNEYEELSSALAALGGNYKPAAVATPAVSVVPASGRMSQERRMKQLLYQPEDVRGIGNEWRRFWFPDQPSHLTPERIHGGIILNQQQFGGLTLPSPKYLLHQPQYFPDDPTFPLPRELSAEETGQRIGIDFNFNPPRRHGLPPMPPPAPLPNPFRDGRFTW